jgi:hypothetical protein
LNNAYKSYLPLKKAKFDDIKVYWNILIPKNIKFCNILFYSNSDLKVSKSKSKIQLLLESNNQFYRSCKAKCVCLCDYIKVDQNCNENCLCISLESKNKP